MALSNQDRVLEKSETTGTGTYRLQGSPGITGYGINDYDTFAAVGNSNTCVYTAVGVDPVTGIPNNTGWEIGLGTYTASGTTLARTTVYRSTNANAAVNWSAGTRFVFCSPVTEGTLVVRQPGGTVGTDEMRLYDTGTESVISVFSGPLIIAPKDGNYVSFCRSSDLVEHVRLECTAGPTIMKMGYGGQVICNTGAPTSSDRTTWFGDGFIRFASAGFLQWSASSTDSGTTIDTGLVRSAASVVGVTAGFSGSGWIQNTAGVAILDSNFTSTSTTMANTNLTCTVISGRSYSFRLLLPIDNATAGDGFKCDFDGSTATMTRFLACAKSAGTITEGVVTSAALATDFTFTSATSTAFVIIEGSFKASGNGTFKLRAAKNSDAAGATMTLLAGARMELNDMVAV